MFDTSSLEAVSTYHLAYMYESSSYDAIYMHGRVLWPYITLFGSTE